MLINVLKDRLIRHAYLDVLKKNHLVRTILLYDLDNVTITAHITGNDSNNNREATDIFKKNLEHFLNNYDVIENKVDLDYGY